MKLIVWLRNRKKYKKPKVINLSNILNYVESEVRYWKSTSKFLDNPTYIDEQSIWRLQQIQEKSPECLQEIRCVGCGCETLSKSFETKSCEWGCYPELMDSDTWENFKKENSIKIS